MLTSVRSVQDYLSGYYDKQVSSVKDGQLVSKVCVVIFNFTREEEVYIVLKVSWPHCVSPSINGLKMNFWSVSHGETRSYKENGLYSMYFNPEIDQNQVYGEY